MTKQPFRWIQLTKPFRILGRWVRPGDPPVRVREVLARSLVQSNRAVYTDGPKDREKPRTVAERERKVVTPPETKAEPPRCKGTTRSGNRCKVVGFHVVDGDCPAHRKKE